MPEFPKVVFATVVPSLNDEGNASYIRVIQVHEAGGYLVERAIHRNGMGELNWVSVLENPTADEMACLAWVIGEMSKKFAGHAIDPVMSPDPTQYPYVDDGTLCYVDRCGHIQYASTDDITSVQDGTIHYGDGTTLSTAHEPAALQAVIE